MSHRLCRALASPKSSTDADSHQPGTRPRARQGVGRARVRRWSSTVLAGWAAWAPLHTQAALTATASQRGLLSCSPQLVGWGVGWCVGCLVDCPTDGDQAHTVVSRRSVGGGWVRLLGASSGVGVGVGALGTALPRGCRPSREGQCGLVGLCVVAAVGWCRCRRGAGWMCGAVCVPLCSHLSSTVDTLIIVWEGGGFALCAASTSELVLEVAARMMCTGGLWTGQGLQAMDVAVVVVMLLL